MKSVVKSSTNRAPKVILSSSPRVLPPPHPTKRRTPSPGIAAKMWRVASVQRSSGDFPSTPMAKSTDSTSTSAFSTSARSRALPSTTLTWSRSLAGSFEGVRASTTPWWPAASDCSRHSIPRAPVAPKIATLMQRSVTRLPPHRRRRPPRGLGQTPARRSAPENSRVRGASSEARAGRGCGRRARSGPRGFRGCARPCAQPRACGAAQRRERYRSGRGRRPPA